MGKNVYLDPEESGKYTGRLTDQMARAGILHMALGGVRQHVDVALHFEGVP